MRRLCETENATLGPTRGDAATIRLGEAERITFDRARRRGSVLDGKSEQFQGTRKIGVLQRGQIERHVEKLLENAGIGLTNKRRVRIELIQDQEHELKTSSGNRFSSQQ